MDEEKRGGESYSYGAVGGLVVLNEMRSGGAEEKAKVERESEGSGHSTVHDLEIRNIKRQTPEETLFPLNHALCCFVLSL